MKLVVFKMQNKPKKVEADLSMWRPWVVTFEIGCEGEPLSGFSDGLMWSQHEASFLGK